MDTVIPSFTLLGSAPFLDPRVNYSAFALPSSWRALRGHGIRIRFCWVSYPLSQLPSERLSFNSCNPIFILGGQGAELIPARPAHRRRSWHLLQFFSCMEDTTIKTSACKHSTSRRPQDSFSCKVSAESRRQVEVLRSPLFSSLDLSHRLRERFKFTARFPFLATPSADL